MKRLWSLLVIVVTLFVLSAAYYLQYIDELVPCPLCLMQRGMTFAILFCALLGVMVRKPKMKRCMALGVLFFALAGLFFASRQLWLQALPPSETGMCLPGVELLVHRLPWHEVVHAFLWGSSSGCGEVTWVFLGLSMAAWSALYFVLMSLVSVVMILRCGKHEGIQN